MTSALKNGRIKPTEQLLEEAVAEWHQVEEEERDLVARDFIYDLVLSIERAANMKTFLARAHLKSLYAKWTQFCKLTEIDLGNNEVERYSEALFGSAIICLNDGKGKAFVVKNKMLWSKAGIDIFNSWVNECDDERSKYYRNWARPNQ
jgi:hypothetical protein